MIARLLSLSLATLLLGACSVLPKAEQPNVYLLPVTAAPTASHAAQSQSLPWSLRIATPQASASLDSNRIAVVPGDHVISVYHGARWADPAPLLLRDRLLDAFRGDSGLRALSSDEEGLQADYVLGGQLRAFQSEYQNGQPVVVIAYDAWLARGSSQRIVACHRFELHQPSQGKQVGQVVDAFGAASTQLSAQLIDWTVDSLRRDAPATRADGAQPSISSKPVGATGSSGTP